MYWLAFRLMGVFVLLLLADFVLWRKWREEYSDEEIILFSLWAGISSITVGILSGWWQKGEWAGNLTSWGILLGVFIAAWWWARIKKWDFWEVADTLTPILAWLWAFLGWWEGQIEAIFALLGLLIVAWVRRGYRQWRWYKSGKLGIVALVFLGWVAISQLTVAFLRPTGIYWGGLESRQWVGAYQLAFVMVAMYLRSGRKIKEEVSWLKFTNNGKKQKNEGE